MSPFSGKFRRTEAGFSLAEIMVGLVIGMVGILVIMQVYSIFEGQKRTTTGAGDAQNGGAIALYTVQREIEQAGYGISTSNIIGCNAQLRAGPPAVTVTLAPVEINAASMVPAGDANTDTLLVAYGNSNSPPEGNAITNVNGNQYAMQAYTSFAVNDMVVALPATRPSPCSGANTLTLTTVTASTNPNVTVAAGVANVLGGGLYNLGAAPVIHAYAVRNGNLTVCDYMVNDCSQAANTGNPAIWVPIANNIVSLRAQYGRDTNTPMDGIVDVYDQATPNSNCGWIKAPAVRMVLVARNTQPGNGIVTANEPAWSGGAANSIDLSGTAVAPGKTWQSYRYKVFETTAPIHNVSLLGVVSGC